MTKLKNIQPKRNFLEDKDFRKKEHEKLDLIVEVAKEALEARKKKKK